LGCMGLQALVVRTGQVAFRPTLETGRKFTSHIGDGRAGILQQAGCDVNPTGEMRRSGDGTGWECDLV